MKGKFTVPLFFICFIGLIILQRELFMPFIYKVVGSDFFLVDSKDTGSQDAISNELTDLAFAHCNRHIKNELDDDNLSVIFPNKPLNAWSIGNYQYVINANVEIISESGSQIKRYVCRISYDKGDDQSGTLDADNWSVYGLSGIN
ncbi:MAG: hypothetical protein CVV13_04000 [Gammaproteobacteria bacterium HGW-Gammaproteobacteria-3]|nr:MAG: hypothetical protein CVV13_04000 [Gammaproteobacteria bacterium HGW-Gammaproteobacteria-3]